MARDLSLSMRYASEVRSPATFIRQRASSSARFTFDDDDAKWIEAFGGTERELDELTSEIARRYRITSACRRCSPSRMA